jgi:hypothetical protein
MTTVVLFLLFAACPALVCWLISKAPIIEDDMEFHIDAVSKERLDQIRLEVFAMDERKEALAEECVMLCKVDPRYDSESRDLATEIVYDKAYVMATLHKIEALRTAPPTQGN